VTVVKSNPELSEMFSPRLYAMARRYYSSYQPGMQKTMATAFPFLQPGLYVTTARALEHGEYADVRTYNNRSYKAEILGYDIASGIGVLKAEIPGTAPLSPPEGPASASESVWVVCYPVDVTDRMIRYLPQSLHRGRLTAIQQTGTGLVSFEGLLRSDHTIPNGCTGGPLVDMRGGTAGLVLGSPDPGLTYSLPLTGLAQVVEAISKKEPPRRPYFGFSLITPDDRQKARFGFSELPAQPLLSYLIPGSPAEKAGLLPGDLLVAVGGQKVATVAEAGGRLLGAAPGGAAVPLTVSRGGKEIQVPVAPVQRPRRILLSPVDELRESLEADIKEVTTGATSRQGLVVMDLVPGGRGEDGGYKSGDIIISVYGRGVRRIEDFNEIVRAQNEHVFGGKKSEATSTYSLYALQMEVRAEGKEKESRSYVNLFPDILAPPVY
jgi:S1-C subfamily serine protease